MAGRVLGTRGVEATPLMIASSANHLAGVVRLGIGRNVAAVEGQATPAFSHALTLCCAVVNFLEQGSALPQRGEIVKRQALFETVS